MHGLLNRTHGLIIRAHGLLSRAHGLARLNNYFPHGTAGAPYICLIRMGSFSFLKTHTGQTDSVASDPEMFQTRHRRGSGGGGGWGARPPPTLKRGPVPTETLCSIDRYSGCAPPPPPLIEVNPAVPPTPRPPSCQWRI